MKKKNKKTRDKNRNRFLLEHAWPGLCSLCFDEIASFDGSDANGKPIVKHMKSSFKQVTFKLNDNSKMVVHLCGDCFENLDESDYDNIIASEKIGWQRELDVCIKDKWSDERKAAYIEKYNKLSIVGRG